MAAFLLGLCLTLMATVTLVSTGVSITDWKYWVIVLGFAIGYLFIARADKGGEEG